MDVTKVFDDLESNKSHESEEAKKTLADFINQTKDQYILHGVMEYYMRTNSVRIIDVLVKMQTPHDIYVLDRIAEWMRGTTRISALNLFGFIVRKHPTWLFKVAKHKLIKEILKLLQTEKEIIPLMSALLCVITLLPIIPSLVPNFLTDLLDVFGHLASWNVQNPNNLPENQLIHLQIGLYMLFHRLYGMYPNTLLRYLRRFAMKDGAIFQHTIKPLLETVRMHPMLIVSSYDNETNNGRWKEKEPHDIVVECAKLSLDYNQDHSECFSNTSFQNKDSKVTESTASLQFDSVYKKSSLKTITGVTSPFHSLADREKSLDVQKYTIWSPSIEILSTPPPTGAVTHTPTPSYSVPNVSTPGNVIGASGASPPEAAVEATPETTPLKDVGIKRLVSANSSAVRSLLASSQPSSPLRKEKSPFHFDSSATQNYVNFGIDQTSGSVTAPPHRLLQMLNDRDQSHRHLLTRSSSIEPANASSTSPLHLFNELQMARSNFLTLRDSPTNAAENAQGDQEVLELTNPICEAHHSDTLQDISGDCGDETEQSPCSVGGLHVPTSRSMRLLERRVKRNRFTTYCVNDSSSYLSYGTSPADPEAAERYGSISASLKVRRSSSWPVFGRQNLLEEESNVDIDTPLSRPTQENVQHNGDSSSPSGDDAMSAATHFKEMQQKSARKVVLKSNKRLDISLLSRQKHCSTQTLQQWPEIYEYNLLELFVEDNKLRSEVEKSTLGPYEIFDQYIDRTLNDNSNSEHELKDQIQLLHLQLHYERYRMEIHAERNRRLLGKSRAVRSLEKDNDRLKDQLKKLQDEVQTLTFQLDKYRKTYIGREQELATESNSWKTKYHSELDTNRQLRMNIEGLQHHLNVELNGRKDINLEIEGLRGELFDMRNDMQHAQYQAELGNQYKQELIKLQSEFMVMGELQVKCRDKICDLENMRARDEEMSQLQGAYNDEIKDLRSALDTKTAHYDTAKHQITDLLSSLANKDIMFTDQKRLLKSAKEEYQEKFKVLDKKYEIQKAIILQLEERITELYKSPVPASVATTTPESEKSEIASSMDHNSPLSISLASSEGLSASLRSVTEFHNLRTLVSSQTGANEHSMAAIPVTSASITSQQILGTTLNSSISVNSQYNINTTAAIGPSTLTQATRSPSISSVLPSSISYSISDTRTTATSQDIPVPGPSQLHRHYHQ